jgi:hypothetical protein
LFSTADAMVKESPSGTTTRVAEVFAARRALAERVFLLPLAVFSSAGSAAIL